MIYPENLEEKLEVDQVRKLIKSYCITEKAGDRVEAVKSLNDFELLSKYHNQTRQCIRILGLPKRPNLAFEDISEILVNVKTEGSLLEGEELLSLRISLEASHSWTQFLKREKDEFPDLFELTLGFNSDLILCNEISSKIDERGEVRSDASPALIRIRADMISAEKKARKSLKKIHERVKSDEYSEGDSEITLREGRLVIPVKAEHKRHLSGFIHDESSTGQTVFMEPTEVLELNNEVRELQYEERREVRRILLEIASTIRLELPDLEGNGKFLLLLDFILAKAKYGRDYESIAPKIVKGASLNLSNAYHPLLRKINSERSQITVPLSISLIHDQNRVLVISGPNAGGKSVALKTVGLLQYMVQCGFPVPVAENSEFGIFKNIFIDIGDSQSLENDLSTYSSRLKAMKFFMFNSSKGTLFLIDEFGTGTEPQFGGALAEEILKELIATKAFGIVTTHYANIKKLAEHRKGVENGAMKYDTRKLEPLFQLEIGQPGSSFAFEIAKKIGLKEELINEAKSNLGSSHVDFDKMLSDLESDKNHYEKLNSNLQKKEQDLNRLRKDYEALKSMIEIERKEIMDKAKREANALIEKANRNIEGTIREIREHDAERKRTKAARENLEKSKHEVATRSVEKNTLEKAKLKVGDLVHLDAADELGEVLSIKKNEAEVRFGQLKSFVKLSRLTKSSLKKEQSISRSSTMSSERLGSFSSELDIRGKRAEEVLPLVDKFVDKAIMMGISELRILHGKGHGILRDVVRNHLMSENQVESMKDEHVERGGAGITLVSLK